VKDGEEQQREADHEFIPRTGNVACIEDHKDHPF
jgi:hypothetical protein